MKYLNNIIDLTDQNYDDVISQDAAIFIDFYSETCSPCQVLKKMLPAIHDYAKEKKVIVSKCNVEHNPKIASKYQIRSIPMTCIIDHDKNIKDVELGLKDISYYIKLINKHHSKKEKKKWFFF